MTHNTTTSLTRLHSLLLAFFGDETLHFHSTRLSNLFNAAFADAEFDDEETYMPNIPRLLHCQNNLQRLLDAAYLLHQHFSHRVTPYRPCVFKQLRHIYPLLNDWDDFPSHLHPHEWCNPETVLEEFFLFQPIDDWKNTVSSLLESALGKSSPFTTVEKQPVSIVLMLQHLLDAVWLLYATGRMPGPKTAKETNHEPQLNSVNGTKLRTHLPFFFIVSNHKFMRMDLDNILFGVSMNDHAFLHTKTGFHKPTLTNDQLKELLPDTQFTWINENIAVRRDIKTLRRPYRLPDLPV